MNENMHQRTLVAMHRDRTLTMLEARIAADYGELDAASERVAAARRINRAIVHYLRNVYRRGQS